MGRERRSKRGEQLKGVIMCYDQIQIRIYPAPVHALTLRYSCATRWTSSSGSAGTKGARLDLSSAAFT